MRGLRGRVVLVDFWTYSCVNCLRTLPYLEAWDRRYRRDGLTIVGVHSPEFPFEHDAGNVEAAIEREGIHYPVVQDNELATWSAWGNQYWPAEYFVDARGHVRFAHFGEGSYGEKERVIRELLTEAGHPPGAGMSGAHGQAPSSGVTTPETYLGAARAERFVNPHALSRPARLRRAAGAAGERIRLPRPLADHARVGDRRPVAPWRSASAPGASSSCSAPRRGRPARCASCSTAARSRPRWPGPMSVTAWSTVGAHRLYELVDLPRVETALLTLVPEAGTSAYAFTFG